MPSPKQPKPETARERRAYAAPRLARFGALDDLTLAIDMGSGNTDGSVVKGMSLKTS
jgi:hypothetical protein